MCSPTETSPIIIAKSPGFNPKKYSSSDKKEKIDLDPIVRENMKIHSKQHQYFWSYWKKSFEGSIFTENEIEKIQSIPKEKWTITDRSIFLPKNNANHAKFITPKVTNMNEKALRTLGFKNSEEKALNMKA